MFDDPVSILCILYTGFTLFLGVIKVVVVLYMLIDSKLFYFSS